MRLRSARHRPLAFAVAATAVLTVLGTGCGSSSDTSGDSPPRSTAVTTTVPTATERPEGSWTFALTTTGRSDDPDLDPGVTEVRLAGLTPTCGSGPCDLDVAPAGADGTYLPEGVAFTEKPNSEPASYEWDEAAETYTRVTGPRKSSCTNAEGKVVPDAYTSTNTTKLTFRPAEGDRPAALIGTFTLEVEATDAGLTQGCTPYEETGTTVGAPVGAFTEDAAPDLDGSYVATETVSEVEPAGQRPPGFTGLLGTFELKASGEGYLAKGVIGEAELAPDGAGFSGATGEVERPCTTTPETPKAFSSIEEFTGLAVVALTEDGDPILAGGWSLSEDPTEAGVAAGCSFSSNTGYLVLVPAASVG